MKKHENGIIALLARFEKCPIMCKELNAMEFKEEEEECVKLEQ